MAFVGMAPFGSLLAGALAHAIGAPRTVIVSGVACILGAHLVLVAPHRDSQGYAADLRTPRHRAADEMPVEESGRKLSIATHCMMAETKRTDAMGLSEDLERIALQEKELVLPRLDAANGVGSGLAAARHGCRTQPRRRDRRAPLRPAAFLCRHGWHHARQRRVGAAQEQCGRALPSQFLRRRPERKAERTKRSTRARACRSPTMPPTADRFR